MNVQAILDSKGSEVFLTRADTAVARAAHDLKRLGVGCLVVLGDTGQVVGLLSERDLVLAVASRGGDLRDARVAEVMTRRVITCRPSDPIGDTMARMTAFRARQMPVLDAGRLCGIVSVGDLVKSRLEDMRLETAILRDAYIASH